MSKRKSSGVKKNTPTAYFDELCQISSLLSCGVEQEWIEFISNQVDLQQRCQTAEGEVTRLRMQLNQIKSDKEASDIRLKHVKKQLGEEKCQVHTLSKQNEKLIQQIQVIREILEDKDRMSMMTDGERQNLLDKSVLRRKFDKVFDDASMELDSDQSLEPSFEVHEEPKEWRRKSRRSGAVRKSERQSVGIVKKKKQSFAPRAPDSEYMVAFQMEPTTSESSEPPVLYPNLKTLKKQNQAEPFHHPKAEVISIKSETTTTTSTTETEYTASDTESISSTTSESSVPHRSHHFTKSQIIKPEQCKACRRRIGFSSHALKCKYCKIVVHHDCNSAAPVPCIPLLSTPSQKKDGTLASYVPKNPPHVPSILVRCVQEIEARGLNEPGLYRISGSEKVIKDLKEKMLRPRGNPNLRKIDDTSVLTGVVRNFLLHLKEPLLTVTLSEEFKQAAEKDNANHLYGVIANLPHENRHTLAFIIIHLQKVAESESCKMPRSNLARVFGPNIVASPSIDDMSSATRENKRNIKVVDQLLCLPPSYWNNMLNPVDECHSPTPYSSEDGPIHTPGTPEMLKVQPGMYQPTPSIASNTPSYKDSSFAQRMFGAKKKTFFNQPFITETP